MDKGNILKLIKERMEKAHKDAKNAHSDMEYDRSIGVYYELDDILDEITKETTKK